MWDYSELSAQARTLGGPDALRAAYVQLGRRLGQRRAFILGALAVGVPVAGWKVLTDYRDRRAVAASQATVGTFEAVPATEESVLAEAEVVFAAVEATPVVDEPEPEPAAESTPSAAVVQTTPAAGGRSARRGANAPALADGKGDASDLSQRFGGSRQRLCRGSRRRSSFRRRAWACRPSRPARPGRHVQGLGRSGGPLA